MRPGGRLYQRDNVTAEELFAWYKANVPAFKDIVLDQFKERLKGYRKAAGPEIERARREMEYFQHDRALYPEQTHDERGNIIFDKSPAKLLLREDIQNEVHLKIHKTAAALQASRPEYHPFQAKQFRDRIRQEIKRNKYFHYLELKREKLLRGKKDKKKVTDVVEPAVASGEVETI